MIVTKYEFIYLKTRKLLERFKYLEYIFNIVYSESEEEEHNHDSVKTFV